MNLVHSIFPNSKRKVLLGNKPGVFRGLPRETILEWPEPSVSTSEYAKLLIDYTPDMAAITACLWMRTRKQDGSEYSQKGFVSVMQPFHLNASSVSVTF